jgi:DNA helicase-2/ATP-dependent DNA helicase PcrA
LLELCAKRRAILEQRGHVLVCGGPGSGKTTIALLKAQRRCAELQPGQEVLFLSFSRAAVRQILTGSAALLSAEERRLVQVDTYHRFCIEFLEAHGRLLGVVQARFLVPRDERMRQATHKGDWPTEQARLAAAESLFCFDAVAGGVAKLLEECAALTALYGEKYPTVIVDEFQDTDDDQWRIVLALAKVSEIVCLADPQQRIFDYRTNIDPRRLDIARSMLAPAEFDLGFENHRSPSSAILGFADCILHNRSPLPRSKDIISVQYQEHIVAATVHAHVVWTMSRLRERGLEDPSLAVLCRSNSFVAQLSGLLLDEHVFAGQRFRPVLHDVVWDADLSAVSGQIVGSVLEWPTMTAAQAAARTVALVSEYFNLKNAEQPSQSAGKTARQFREAAGALAAGNAPKIKAAKRILESASQSSEWSGDPVRDWLRARSSLETIEAVGEIIVASKMIRLFRATDVLAAGLAELWLRQGHYGGAASFIRRTLDRERLLASERESRGCVLMTMHKSKGKEFDGVALVEGKYRSPFFAPGDGPLFERSRRLLRVAITRARQVVTLIRPEGAHPLVGGAAR